ncbi:DUF3107 domain-containing protein [Bifidobacterium psychraerophilum]|jgi:hypothetical protein|uniref:Carbonic anhydrase n=1 Tax=Bifidobacterium psychraerophilum TaxID=218140 RepID=A0A087CEC0_9BIFI|nr:DUF3107 domain-containing protein [Bifidobacterium psychraerophilum]KFI81620.1 carbonic anhydrase [Bifidobacterium psychraerophilum]MCI1804858.1 DUF3107 domain-containing protein [Bifidobacterium psychraerophilum]MCI2176806.1 DUF3107 domain-containing protein [Bifidobacterium psychraerophilum]MCI2182608.1 DUF3107 domain-containing protein [Bifidobacterium psychraerophilum]PKA93873.1 uncharacterized protein DUF3107 [Bifidobacterium psychraerophilum DSM 22366]
MDIEIGIRNVTRTVSFSTDASAEEVAQQVEEALASDKALDLKDNRGRRILVPAQALGYAIIGSDTSHPVGFGAL